MIKKPISKFKKIFNKNLIQKSKGIILGILIALLFLPVLTPQVSAQERIEQEIRARERAADTAATTKTDPCNATNFINSVVETSRSKLAPNEKIDLYMKFELDPKVGPDCENSATRDLYQFSPYLYYAGCEKGSYKNYRISYPATWFNEGGKYGYHALIRDIDIVTEYKAVPATDRVTYYCFYAYFNNKAEAPYYFLPNYASFTYDASSSNNPAKTPFPSSAVPKPPSPAKAVIDNNESVSSEKLAVKFLSKDGKGLRAKYRMAMSDTKEMVFGKITGLDGLTIDWSDDALKLSPDQYIKLEAKNDTTGLPNFDTQYKYTNIAFTYSDAKWDGNKACAGAYVANQTCEVLFYSASTINNNKGEVDLDLIEQKVKAKILSSDPVTLSPLLKPLAWQKKEFAGKKSVNGEPIGKVEFLAVPYIWARGGLANEGSVYVMGQTPPKFVIEVFETEQQIIDLCKKENSSNPSVCTPEYSRYGIGSVIEQSTASSSTDAETSAAGELFSFIRKIVAYIVLLLTSFIYWIFSTILVPILVALIQVHPYKDEFVNFVYPGWIIVRNLSNILFIIALLYTGLKILFQQQDASTSRGFITTLILMALLVNFSLVIGQGIVAIADTVQAQFLPEESKVIETLGHKLMVDPIIIFRGGDDSLTSVGGNFTSESAASDIPKAIMLLVLSVAAFFSFVALIAFMFVRIVMLWVLYMVSPFAYVGRILPETKKYANDWWSQFIKYAFSVPILAFFLNMAALVAVTFSAQSGDQVQVQGARGYLLGSAAAGVTEFALTTVSHFVVLIFLFAGMKVALSVGGAGAKQIVGAAKKGFDAVTRKFPKAAGIWAKDTGGDMGANLAKKLGYNRLATGIRAAVRPGDAIRAVKKGYFDEPKKKMNENFTKTFDSLSKRIQPWGENKAFPLKMAWWKMRGKDYDGLMAESEEVRRKAGILTDEERDDIKDKNNKLANDSSKKAQRLALFEADMMSVAEGKEHVAAFDEKIKQNLEDQDDLNQRLANAIANNRSPALIRDLQKKVDAKVLEHDDLFQKRDDIDSVLRSIPANATEFDIRGLDFKPVLDIDQAKIDLQEGIDADNVTIDTNNSSIKADDKLRKEFNVSAFDKDDRAKVIQDADKLADTAQKRERPPSKSLEDEERAEVNKQKKEIADLDLDYDQLRYGFEEALAKNNTAQAKAYMKQMAEDGHMQDFLEANGNKQYNLDNLEKIIREQFKGTNKNQIAFINEISNVSAKNGSLPLGFAVRNLAGGGGVMHTEGKRNELLAKKMEKMGVKDVKGSDVEFLDPKTGQKTMIPGLDTWVNNQNNTEKAKVIKRDMHPKTAEKILNWVENNPGVRKSKIALDALREAAGKGTQQNTP